MYKFVVLSVVAFVASVSGAPGNLVVPVAAPAIAVGHPVQVATATSYSNTYRAPVVKAIPLVKTIPVVAAAPATHQLVHAAPVVAAPVIAAHPVVKTTHQLVAHPAPAAIVKTSPVLAHAAPITVAHAPLVHTAPITAVHGLPITGYANHYKVAPLIKTGVLAAPVALVHWMYSLINTNMIISVIFIEKIDK